MLQEVQLYSDKLKLAGTTDLFAVWDNKLAIIDFKNSLKPKREDWITSYFLQATIYARMAEERCAAAGIKLVIPTIVIPVACQTGEVQIFEKSSYEYMDELERRLELFETLS